MRGIVGFATGFVAMTLAIYVGRHSHDVALGVLTWAAVVAVGVLNLMAAAE